MNVLELFSGTGSIKKVCDKIGFTSVSVDMLLPADYQCDIMDFDYKQFPKDTFDIIWASPPCTSYSNLQSCWLGRKKKDGIFTKEKMMKDMDEADKLILKTFEIINYFDPYLWFVENPQTGKLKDRKIMKNIPFYDVSYCMYSNWGYEKKTRIWTNKKNFNNLICDKSGKCGNMIDNNHKKVLGNGYIMSDGKKILVNTKEKRLIHKARMGTSKTIIDDGKIIRVNTAELRKKYKNYENMNHSLNNDTGQLDRYRVPEDLIFSLLLE
jgi:site-specific DNA-cytosine methylase